MQGLCFLRVRAFPQALLFALLSIATTLRLDAAENPDFTDIIGQVEMQPIAGAKLIYWDQAAADALGIESLPGRVGDAAFEKDVLGQMGYEIKEGAIANPAQTTSTLGHIEVDAHGGSGRAGYVQTRSGAWVNIKGVGQTGYGNTGGKRGPPQNAFSSHQDGSATLEEAIKETVSARVANNELSTPSSRVVAIIDTGRTLKFADGRVVRLATIVRQPVRRLDRAKAKGSTFRLYNTVDTLAQLNVKRFLKGDLVNDSNIGAGGEMIDFGTFTSTGGHVPASSSQNVSSFDDQNVIRARDFPEKFFNEKVGEHLLTQWGVPENMVARASEASRFYDFIGQDFIINVNSLNDDVLVDYNALTSEQILGRVRLHETHRDLAADFFEAPISEEDYVRKQMARLPNDPELAKKWAARSNVGPEDFKGFQEEFYRNVWQALKIIEKQSPVADRADFARKIREVAHHKSKIATDLVRPNLMGRIGDALEQAKHSNDPAFLQNMIDDVVRNNRQSLVPPSDGLFHVAANGKNTDYYLKANRYADGSFGPHAYPEIRVSQAESAGFRVSTNGWQTQKDVPAQLIKTPDGEFIKMTLDSGDFPPGEGAVEMSPFKNTPEGQKWFGVANLRGPLHKYSHQYGLEPDYNVANSLMRDAYDVRLRMTPEDLRGESALTPGRLEYMLTNIKNPTVPTTSDYHTFFNYIPTQEAERLLKDPKTGPIMRKYADQLRQFENFVPHLPKKGFGAGLKNRCEGFFGGLAHP